MMRFLCDVHISIRLSKHIAGLGLYCEHVNNVLDGFRTKDSDISQYCNNNSLILITKDRDFKNSFLLSRKPKRLIKINLGNISNDQLITLINRNIQSIQAIHDEFQEFMIELEIDGTLTITK